MFVAADERIVMPGHAAQLAAQHQRFETGLACLRLFGSQRATDVVHAYANRPIDAVAHQVGLLDTIGFAFHLDGILTGVRAWIFS